ncbi:hypothetical protein E2562_038050 [Oryza meyeriana var. granulata]|uniref:DUF4228 domain-containing protein n=1 Tax=Oryza meyeriana var. granulata TaxID=110450 RepID=A0A6G1EU01_9ORYZ|nr:hypothetical protein E2562_038050 [Oryza meyeriana var. granulata]
MGNSLRCCLACVLPCGALDLIRIVHLNGRVEEYGRPVAAGEILAANPNHVLSKPCSQGVVRRILIVSPDSELERGEIYFLIPASSVPEKKKKSSSGVAAAGSHGAPATGHLKTTTLAAASCHGTKSHGIKSKQASSDHGGNGGGRRHLRDVMSSSEKRTLHRRRMSTGSRTAWRPHLECIVENT